MNKLKWILSIPALLMSCFLYSQCWVSIGCGINTTYAIKSDGTLWAWGEGSSGQLGNGGTGNISIPSQVGVASNWAYISSGSGNHALGIKSDGTRWVWGWNQYNQISGNSGNILAPTQSGNSMYWSRTVVSYGDSYFLTNDNRIYALGWNNDGQIGNGVSGSNSGAFLTGSDWECISAGYMFAAAVKTNGTLWTWGNNDWGISLNGQTGPGTNYDSPHQTTIESNWDTLACSSRTIAALKTDGTLWIWGGQIGPTSLTNNNILYTPTQLGIGITWKKISCGGNTIFAIANNGTLWSVGSNSFGQLGIGTNTGTTMTMTQVGNSNDWRDIRSGDFHTIGIKNDGTIWTWGRNDYGQLGLGLTPDQMWMSNVPVQVLVSNCNPINPVDNDGDGYTIANGDCNDFASGINPTATEICDNIDNNCNTQIDEGFDQDGDGVTTCAGDCNDTNAAVYIGAIDITDGIDNNCDGIIDENFDADGDGVTPADGDCNDANPAIGPTQLEVCNSIDDNCNGQIDEGFDLDNDGYTICSGDCNDANNLINPGVLDLADGIDNDCDGAIDENFDADGDGVTPADGDCNDANPAIGPNQIEYCNGIDDNCNNLIDENFDADNDGFTLCNGDCNDYNAAIYPGAIELDDNIDNNCDGSIDEIFDGDGDGVSPADGDCNDSNPNIGPNALEICNNVDDNCNGLIDEDLDCSTENMDMFVPTGFSPNNDGFNDSWQIPWLVNQSGYSVMVVNRWEQRIFFTNNFANGWDGTYEGEKLPTADYYYVITLSDGNVLSGALTIKY